MDADALADALTGAGYSRKTVAVYLTALRPAAAALDLEAATPTQVAAYAETLPRTRSSRALLRAALGAFWRLQGRPDAPTGAVRVPTHPRMRCKALEDHQAAVLAHAARRRHDLPGLAVLLGLYAGLRRAEIARLRWSEIGPDGWLTIVGKGDVTRSLPLHPAVLEALGSLRGVPDTPAAGAQRPGYVFAGRWGGPVNPTTVWGWVRLVATAAGLATVPTHVLRHTCLATALDTTRDLRAVQELAGHARPETTAGYTRVRRDRLTETVAAIEYGAAS